MIEIDFKRPQLEDKEIISHYFNHHTSRSCERTFVNVYLYARVYHAEYAVIQDTLVIRTEYEGQMSYAYPAGRPENVKKVLDLLLQYNQEKGLPFLLHAVTSDNFAQLEEWYPGRFAIEYLEEDADYVYESEKLATLSGKKLHSKRNHINKFKTAYEGRWSYEPITEDNLEECFQMALAWRNQSGCEEDEEKNSEMCATLNSLRLFRELELVGGLLRVDGQVVAFTIGERLCSDTFVVHIEKAYADVQGAYTMINQQFVEQECAQYQYINREEDTGAEGLRKAKKSYRPAFMIEKGIVTEK